MEFFGEAVTALQTLVVALGAGLCVWVGWYQPFGRIWWRQPIKQWARCLMYQIGR